MKLLLFFLANVSMVQVPSKSIKKKIKCILKRPKIIPSMCALFGYLAKINSLRTSGEGNVCSKEIGWGFPGGASGKEPACRRRRRQRRRIPGLEDPLEKEMQPTLVLLPGESHGQRSLGHTELDRTEAT